MNPFRTFRTHLGRQNHSMHLRRNGSGKMLFENLEPRTLLSATLYVSATGMPADGAHFQTLQAALAVAVAGDTVELQDGFSAGSFIATSLKTTVSAGVTSLRTAAALDVGDVVSIGNMDGSDPLERALVTGVSAGGADDFVITLASPLTFSHATGCPVDAANSGTTGPTIGITRAISLTADSGVVVPFNLEIWQTATGVTLRNLTLNNGNSLYLDGDGNTLDNVQLTGSLEVEAGSSGNTLSNSALASVRLNPGSRDNTFMGNVIGALAASGAGDFSGHDVFLGNMFTGAVKITGNATLPTADSFIGNVFTVSRGNALTLEHADGTLLQGNTFTISGNYANAIVVHNSAAIVISANEVTTTGTMGTGVWVYADGMGASGVTIDGNVLHTTSGFGIYLEKDDDTAALAVCVQGNDLQNNAMGVYVWGDGSSAGNIDLGGGSTSAGGNDFSSFATAADAGHFAIGLFNTSASFELPAENNVWTADPNSVIADATHTPAASGSGLITLGIAPETISVTANNVAAVETATTSGIIATFTSTASHVAGDFTAAIDWGDGTSSVGTVTATDGGGFAVQASHTWTDAGDYRITVTLSDNAASATATSTATITARTLTLQGINFTIDKKLTFNGAVANFTDNLPGTTAAAYVASVVWTDGLTTAATIVKNADGSFSVLTSRKFTRTGVVVASVSVGTVDGDFSAVANLTATVTCKNDNRFPPIRQIIKFLRLHCVKKGPCSHAPILPASAHVRHLRPACH